MMLGMLAEKGHTFTDDEAEAEAAVINTCCFIGDAKEESINTILEMAELKKGGQLKALIVAGCLAQRYKEEIQTEIPEVDEILGTMAIDAVTLPLMRFRQERSTTILRTRMRRWFTVSTAASLQAAILPI